MRVLLIDNYDSFTWNLVHLIGGLGAEVDVWRNDALTVDEALAIEHEFHEMMHSQGKAVPDEDVLEDGIAFLGVSQFPARVKCALLGWSAWKDAAAQALATTTQQQEEA